jgi:hypothetical protein
MLISFALPRASLAQSGVYSGEVKDSATLAPLSDVKVSLVGERNTLVGSSTTDSRGLFSIPHHGGVFQLRFDRPAMKSVYGPVDTVRADSVVEREYKASFVAIPFDSVFYESQVEVPVMITADSRVAPRYPPSLAPGMRGSVSLSFVVDTAGHVEMGSVKTLHSSDGAFFKSVMDALPHMAFTPARIAGRKVRQLVLQRFDFGAPISR